MHPSNLTMTSTTTWKTIKEIHSIEKEKKIKKSGETITMKAIGLYR